MKVYLIQLGYDYEGAMTQGVRMTLAEAELAAANLIESEIGGDYLEIEEWDTETDDFKHVRSWYHKRLKNRSRWEEVKVVH